MVGWFNGGMMPVAACDFWPLQRARFIASLYASRLHALFAAADRDEIPALRPSFGAIGKMALDEFALALIATWSTLPAVEHRRRSNAEVLEALDLFENRGWLAAPRSYHRQPPPLEHPEIRAVPQLGLPVEHLSFESGYEPDRREPGRDRWLGFAANRIAHAWVLRHATGPRPWILCIHAFSMGAPALTLRAFPVRWLHHKLGLNVILPVLPLHGPRRVGWKSGDRFLGGEHMNSVFGMAQAIWDIRRILGWARSEGAPAVGCYGLSLGGYTTALLAAIDERVDYAIAGIPAACLLDLERRHTPPFARTITERARLDWRATERVFSVISPLAIGPLVPRERRFLFAGLGDRLAPPDHVRALWRHWDRPRIHWYEGGHLSFRWDPGVRGLLGEALAR